MTTRERLNCEQVQALAGAFALDAVSEEEANAIREHIETCADCRKDIRRMVEVAQLMPLALDEVAPPPALRQRILDAVADDSLASGIVALRGARDQGAPTERPAAGPAAVEPRTSAEEGGSRTGRGRAFWASRAWPALAAAALLLALGLGGWNYTLQQNAPRVYNLQAPSAPQASGQLVYLPARHTAYFTIDRAPDPGTRRTYQMWLIRDGKPQSVGTVRPDQNGKAGATLSQDLSGYQKFAVTVEPEEGSAQPTGEVVLSQQL
jgi:anti-sigma-K factor RskA